MITQAEIDNTIILEQNKLVYNTLKAAKQDKMGNWSEAECYLTKAEKSRRNIRVLRTKCDTDISCFVNENTEALVCNLEEDTGIGKWAIKPSLRNCNIFKIRGGQLPPPYGEFSLLEFPPEEVTEVITS